MHRLNRGITGSWWLVVLNTYLALSIVGTTLLMIDPGDSYVSAFIGPIMSALLPGHVMYVAIAFALPQVIYLVLAGYALLNLISTRRILAYTNIAAMAACYLILYARPAWELHLATVCLAGMVVALALEIVIAYKRRALQTYKGPS